MKYAYTILYVQDILETVLFYEKAFGFTRKFVTPENDYAELSSGETTLAFASHELGSSNFNQGYEKMSLAREKPFGIELVFITDKIEQDFQVALDAGAVEFEAVAAKPWGQKVGYLRDNNGYLIEIATPIFIQD